LENAVCVPDVSHVPVMVLDHGDRGAHPLGEEIGVDALAEPERRVGMPETVGGPGNARRAGP
jgi:hypothetical protein